MNEIENKVFDYTLLDSETSQYLKDRETSMERTLEKTAEQLGEDLYKAQQRLAKKGYGNFEDWFTSLGIKKSSAYNYIKRYSFVQQLDEPSKKEMFRSLPARVQIEMSKPSANDEINQKVFNGDIKTHKEYKELEKKLKQAQSEKEQAERTKQFAIEQLEREQNKEPKVITEMVEKEVVPDDYEDLKRMNQSLKNEIEFANKKYSMLEASTRSAKELEQKIRSLEDREQSVTQRIEAIERLNDLEEEFEQFFDTKVAPMRFKPITDELYGTNATQRIRQLVETARHWVEEMEDVLPQRDIQYAEIIEED